MSTSTLARFRHLLAAIPLALAFAPVSAQSPLPVEGPTVDLPQFTVTESPVLPEPEQWRYARVGDFEVISQGTEANTRRLLADFETFLRAVRLVWPAPPRPLAASTLILCGQQDRFTQFLPPGPRAEGVGDISRLLRDAEQVAIVVNFAASRIDVADPTAVANTGGSAVEYEVDHYRQLYREYVHLLLSQVEVRPPAWLEEGLAQIVMDIELTSRSLIYGKIVTDRGAAAGGQSADADESDATVNSGAVVGEQPFNVVLRHRRLLPLDRFFAVGHDSPEVRSPLGNTLWAKQAYAFVHFCLFGEDLRHKDGLIRLAQRLAREPMSEPLFRECFGLGYADMQKQLSAYLRHVRHRYQRYDLSPTEVFAASDIALREATQPEIGLILGDALRLAGRPAEAHAAYRTAYLRGGREPALLAALGQAELAAGHAERGHRFLDIAVKTGVRRPGACVAQARLRLADARAAAPDGRLSAEQLAAVLAPLFQARQVPPPLPATYELIAEAWELSAAPPKLENIAVLDEGVRRFPRHSELVLSTARLNRLAGEPGRAAAIAQLGLRYAGDEASRSRLQALLSELPPPPARGG